MMTTSNFSERLATLVRLTGKSERACALEAGVSPSGMSRYLAGDRFPSTKAAQKLAAFFKIPLELFLQADAARLPEPQAQASLVSEAASEYAVDWRRRAMHAEDRLHRTRLKVETLRDSLAALLKTEFENYDL